MPNFSAIDANTAWKARGKLAIRARDPKSVGLKRSAYTLGFDWRQHEGKYQIDLAASLGFARARIEGQVSSDDLSSDLPAATLTSIQSDRQIEDDENSPTQVKLFRGGKLIDQSKHARALFYRQTGLDLPIESLRFWLVGKPNPSLPVEPLSSYLSTHNNILNEAAEAAKDAQIGFIQGDWIVSYSGQRHSGEKELNGNYVLPRKLTANHAEFKLVVAITRWQIGAE